MLNEGGQAEQVQRPPIHQQQVYVLTDTIRKIYVLTITLHHVYKQ